MIYTDIHTLAENLKNAKAAYRTIVATSGGFDPLHVGHLRCIQQAKELSERAILVVIVNGDGFLTRKKGKPFMRFEERAEIVNGLRSVDFVVGWDDGSQTVTGALEILKPNIFAKGGDRSSADKVPEFELCEKIGCKVVFGVGGTEKVQSSSDLIKNSSGILDCKLSNTSDKCEHNWVMDGHNAGDPICSKCFKRE